MTNTVTSNDNVTKSHLVMDMAQTKNRRTASVARQTQPNNRRSNTRQQSNSRQSTPT
jgi:hypothetical protein